MDKIYYFLGTKLNNLGLRFRMAFEACRQRTKGWRRVVGVTGIFRNIYHMEVVLLAQRFLDPRGTYTLVDVGANVGGWAQRFLAFIPCEYTGFEPDPRAFSALKIAYPTTQRLYNKCVGNMSGQVTINLGQDTTYSSKYEYDDRLEQRPVMSREIVHQVRLDESELGAAPYILKIDVQGGESEVLEGATQTLKNTIMIILETPLFRQTQGANSLVDVILQLGKQGFQPVYFCHPGMVYGHNTIPVEHDLIFLNMAMIDPVNHIQ